MSAFRGSGLSLVVVPSAQPPSDEFRLLVAEVYTDRVIVRWAAAGPQFVPEWDPEWVDDRGPVRRLLDRIRHRGWTSYGPADEGASVSIRLGAGLELADDAGTAYEPRGGFWHADDTGVRGEFEYLSAPPHGARALTLTSPGAWSVELRLDDPSTTLSVRAR